MVASALRRADRAAPALDLPALLLAVPLLGLARLLPPEGAGLYLRLAGATAVVLLPGFLVARALGRRSASAGLVFALALVALGLAATFALSASLLVAGVVLAAAGALALPLAVRPRLPALAPGPVLALAAGALFGMLLWAVSRPPGGDALFHLARVRKLAELDALSLAAVGEFADGGLHPGYAFPLWHGLLALVGELAAVDPAAVLRHEAAVLAPLAVLVAYEAGTAVFRSAWLGGAVAAGHVALTSLAAGHGGVWASLAQPPAAGRLLLAPAVVALALTWTRAPAWDLLVALAAAGLVLALVHVTYVPFVALVLAGFLVARLLLARTDGLRLAAALTALLVPAAAVAAWLLPIARDTASHDPSAGELERALTRYARHLELLGDGLYRLAPEVVSRGGAVAVAALALVPLAALAPRRRGAAFVLGGTLAVLAVLLVPELFTRLSDAVSLSQSRRLASFVPFAFALAAGAAVLARVLRVVVVPVALAAGVVLQRLEPGDFTPLLEEGGGPRPVVWFAAFAGMAALALAAALRRPLLGFREDWLPLAATLLFVLPVAASSATEWGPTGDRRAPLSPGLVAALREQVPERAVVFSDLETSYRIAAFAPVYVAAAPPAHVADTVENRPYQRREDVLRFLRTGDLAIPRSYGATWLVLDRSRFDVRLGRLRRVYADGRYVLYRLRSLPSPTTAPPPQPAGE